MTKYIVNKRTDALKTDINLFFFYDNKLSNFPLSLADASHEFQIHVSVRILTIKINQWVRVNFCSYRKICNSCIFYEHETKDVLGHGPFNIWFSFDVYRFLPFPSIDYFENTWALVLKSIFHSFSRWRDCDTLGLFIYGFNFCLVIYLFVQFLFCFAISAQYTSVSHGAVHVTHKANQKEATTPSPSSPWRRTF